MDNKGKVNGYLYKKILAEGCNIFFYNTGWNIQKVYILYDLNNGQDWLVVTSYLTSCSFVPSPRYKYISLFI